jgi:hypothetical protein
MKARMTILAALFGVAMLTAPGVASAHPMPAWRRAFAAQRFQTMGPKGRFNFLQHHPYFRRHRWQLNQPYAMQNGWVGNRPFAGAYGPGGWNQRAGYMNGEPDGDEGYQRPCPIQPGYGGYGYGRGGDGDGDDGGGYGAGYAMPMGGYGYGYSPLSAMLSNFIP